MLLQVSVKPGELENLRALMQELGESTQGEPGTLASEQTINDANDLVQSYERLEDDDFRWS